MKRSLLRTAALALIAVVAASACSDLETRFTGPNDDAALFDVFFEIPSGSASSSAAPAPDFSVRLTDDQGNVLNVTGGELVVREMELRRAGGECVDSDGGTEDDGDSCEEITVDPQVLSLPVDQEAVQIVNQLPVSAGTYDRLEFDLQVATEEDQQVIATNPELLNHSIQLGGAFNNSAFSVVLTPEAPIDLDFPQTIQAEEGTTSRVTLVVEMSDWFRAEDGSLLDPETVEDDAALEERVGTQIIESFSIELGPPETGS